MALPDKYTYYLKKLIFVSTPVVLGQVGHMAMNFVDTFMVGHLGSVYLSAATIANTVFIIPFIFCIGFTVGITPLTGHANSTGDDAKCSGLLRHAAISNLLLGIVITLLMWPATWIMPHLHQDAQAAALAAPFFTIINFSLIPMMVFLSFSKFTDGLGLTIPAMVASLLFNVVNAVLNWALIYGHLGLPAMGMNGSAMATLISRVGMALFMVGYIYATPLKKYLVSFGKFVWSWPILKELFDTGFPIGLQFLFEVGAFLVGTIMIGTISHQAQAAHQICMSMVAFTYMMSSGVGSGATIVISNLYGRKEIGDIRVASSAAFTMVLVFMGACAVMFLVGKNFLPTIFNNEPEVVGIAATLLIVGAFFQLSDGFQVVIIGALRGLSDVMAPTVIAFVSYWIITLPLCYLFAFHFNYGPVGVWYGYLIGLSVAALLLLLRFRYLLKQKEREFLAGHPSID